MTSDPRGRHGTATIRSDTWRQSKHRFHMFNSHHRIAVLNKTSMTRGSFVHSHMWTLQTITGKVKPNHASIPQVTIDRMKNPRPPQAYMTSDRHDGLIPTRPQARDNLSFTQQGIGKYSDSRTAPVIKDSIGFPDTNIRDEDSPGRIADSVIIAS